MRLSGVRVLLAEDNPTNQLVAMQMLESLGATVTLARDGAEAFEIAAEREFDVMLVDIEMPRVDGVEVIRRIRAWPGPRAQLPMIALTAYVMREHRAAIDAAGADGVIAKPILSIEQLGADIARFMSGRATVSAASGDGTAEAAHPVIDRSVYDALAQAIGTSAMAELLEKVDADVRLAQSRLSQALEARDVEEIRSAAHILVSVAGAIGAVRVQQGAKKLDAAAEQGDLVRLEREAPGVFGEIEHMLEVVCANQAG